MRNPKYTFIAIGAYLALIGVLAVTTSGPAHTQGGQNSGPAVRVISMPAEPVSVTQFPQGPIQFTLSRGLKDYTVPAGKRLVIEHVSGGISSTDDVIISATIRTTVGEPITDSHSFPLTLASSDGSIRLYSFGGPARLYADPGTSVSVGIRHFGSDTPNVNAVVSGNLVDAP